MINLSQPDPPKKPQLLGPLTGSFTPIHFFVILFLVFLAYGYPSTLLSLNADDVIQIQPASNDTTTFLSIGRWGYYFVFDTILKASPGGWIAAFFGSFALCLSGWIMSQECRLKTALSVSLFIGLGAVSLPYVYLFSFDSTRLAYSIGVFISVLAVALVRKYRVWSVGLGLALLTAAPSFYPASLQVAVTFIILAAIADFRIATTRKLCLTLLLGGLAVLVAGVLYSFLNQLFQGLLGVWPNPRVSFYIPLNLNDIIERILSASDHTLPSFLGYSHGFPKPTWVQWVIWIFGLLFLYSTLRRVNGEDWVPNSGILIILIFGMLVAPMSLSLIAPPQERFPPRTMIAIPIVYAYWIAFPLEVFSLKQISLRPRVFVSIFVGLALMPILYFAHSLVFSNTHAYDEFLATQEDLFRVNRITAAVEQKLGEEMKALPNQIPLVVIGGRNTLAGPRGRVGSARFAGWSREWIFRFTDRRFYPLAGPERSAIVKRAGSGPTWPHPGSIEIFGETVVVRLP